MLSDANTVELGSQALPVCAQGVIVCAPISYADVTERKCGISEHPPLGPNEGATDATHRTSRRTRSGPGRTRPDVVPNRPVAIDSPARFAVVDRRIPGRTP